MVLTFVPQQWQIVTQVFRMRHQMVAHFINDERHHIQNSHFGIAFGRFLQKRKQRRECRLHIVQKLRRFKFKVTQCAHQSSKNDRIDAYIIYYQNINLRTKATTWNEYEYVLTCKQPIERTYLRPAAKVANRFRRLLVANCDRISHWSTDQ